MNELHILHITGALTVIFSVLPALAQEFRPPAGTRFAQIGANGSILPGGRFLKPYGVQLETGPGPFAIAVSPKGIVATVDIGFERFGITVLEASGKTGWHSRHVWARTPDSPVPEIADPDWTGVSYGSVFDAEKSLWVSEGRSGRLRQLDLSTGDHKKIINLNSAEWHDSFTGALVSDPAHHLLYAVDRSNPRIAILDLRSGRILASAPLDAKTFAIALSPDAATLWVTQPHAVCALDVHNVLKPAALGCVSAPSPASLLAVGDRVFAANSLDDSITVISASRRAALAEITLGIPSLEKFRGVIPAGLAYDPLTKWLLVAESGVNALGVVDTEKNEVIGHIPTGWMPTQVAISGDRVFVTNARGQGTGPNPRRVILELGEAPVLHRGTVSTFILPDAAEVLRQTGTVFLNTGLVPYMYDPPAPPDDIKHVVLILKGNRTFDEVFGDIGSSNVAGSPGLAVFGMHGRASGGKSQFSVKDVPITPNLHAIAHQWTFSDNFYSTGDALSENQLALNADLPDPITETSLRAGLPRAKDSTLADHLKSAGVTFREIDQDAIGQLGDELPGLLVIHIPGDSIQPPRPEAGYPYVATYVAENDVATGKVLEHLSHSPSWRSMTVFITESDTNDSLDHIDSHRTLLLAAGPWVRNNSVLHLNSDYSGLLRTIFEVLRVPPLNLMDRTAASLREIFKPEPDFTPFDAVPADTRILPARR